MRYDEKREYKRHDFDAPIVYVYQDSAKFYRAQMQNYCKGGMCFESNDALEPGVDIYIMMESFSPDTIVDEFYDGYLAEVRWCQKILFTEAGQFKVGVKYYQTVIK